MKLTLIKWMRDMISTFPQIYFKYHHDQKSNKHIVGVYPQSFVESSETYCKYENDFYFNVLPKFPDETVLFQSEQTLCKLPDSAQIIKNLKRIPMENMVLDCSIKIVKDKKYDWNTSDITDNSFQMAA